MIGTAEITKPPESKRKDEENMNIGVDHGYYAVKTRHFSFPAGITAYR